jgi:Putative GTPase activating protein for Arf
MADSQRSKKKAEQEQQRQIQEMLNLPENQNCADCAVRGPRWAAVNIGCFLCNLHH